MKQIALQAVILAGGRGTRLQSLSNNLPKSMTPILGKPLLQYQIELCANQGITDIQILVGYCSEAIKEYFTDGSFFGVKINYHQETELLGTAGALLDVLDSLNDDFIVIYGDTFLNIDLISLCSFHFSKKADVTLFLHPNSHPQDSDLIEINSKLSVTNIHTYPHSPFLPKRNLVNAGLYIIKKSILRNVKISSKKPDIAKNLFPKLLKIGASLCGYVSTEYIKDMGTPDRLDFVEKDIISGKVEALSRKSQKRAFFLDRDGVINREVGHLKSISQFELIPGVGKSIKKINNAGILVIVITNQPVIARGELSEKNLRIIHNKMDTLLGNEGSYVDAIYYCPHHPDSGFEGEVYKLKKECKCRKPSPGLLFQAVDELNISLEKSWMVGDSSSDILAANQAGVQSILVKTGFGGKDGKYTCSPNYIASDLERAVDWAI